jgi:SAM-dependent methyltransferase
VVAAVLEMQEPKNLTGDYFEDRELLASYLLYPWVLHYLQGLSLIGELPHTPRRVLDVCSGPGAFAFAALRHGATEVYATDRNVPALELGAEVCGRFGMTLNVRHWNCLKGELPVEGHFDLITVGYCLEELFPESQKNWKEHQQQFIQKMLKRLTPQGFLMIVEDSFPQANRRVLTLRDHFVGRGVPVQAPCVWRGECPALQVQNSPCYAQREFEKPYLVKEIQRAAKINLSSLKMSYLIFRHPEAGWPMLPDKSLYRVISPPVEAFQGKRFYLCGTDGKKFLESHLKEHPKESRSFDFLKRGELISVENALQKQNALDIVVGTKVTLEAPLGKPLPNLTSEEEA